MKAKKTVILAAMLALMAGLTARADDGDGTGNQTKARKQQRECTQAQKQAMEQKRAQKQAHWQQQKQERHQHRQQMQEETKAFNESLKGMSEEDRIAARTAFMEARHQEHKTFSAQQYTENMAFLQQNLANNQNLTDAQKTELVSFFEQQHQENVSFRDQRYSTSVSFMQKVAADDSLTMEQRKQMIQEHRQAGKAERAAHHQQQVTERQAMREQCKGAKGAK